MAAKNQTIVARGSELTLDVYFRAYAGGNLVDSSPDPTYIIKNPTGTQVFSGTGVKFATGSYTAKYDIPISAEISTDWKIEWTATVNGSVITDEENFRVVEAGDIGFGGDILIDDKWLNKVKMALGYPRVTLSFLTDEQIKEYAVEPALREYFTKFPLEESYIENVSDNTTLEIDFPDEYTFGVLDMKITDRSVGSSANNWSIWELSAFQNYGLNSSYGWNGYNPENLWQSNYTKWQSDFSFLKHQRVEFMDIDENSRKLTIHTNQGGKVEVKWAKYSYDFSEVKFQQIENVIKLAQSYYLRFVADISGMISDTDKPININADELKTKSDELRDSVYEKWLEYVDIPLIMF